MRRRARRLLSLGLLAITCTACGDLPGGSGRSLPLGEEATGTLAPGGEQIFRLSVPAGEVLVVTADTRWVDGRLTLEDPTGAELLAWDSPGDRWGMEEVLVRGREAGVYRLSIRGGESGYRDGTFTVTVTTRPPTAEDGARILAQSLYRQALERLAEHEEGSLEEALALLRRGTMIRGLVGDPRGQANSLYWQGMALKDLRRFEEAEKLLEEAFRTWRGLGEVWGEAETLYRLGAIYRLQGRMEAAQAAFRDAIPRWRESGDERGVALSLYNLAYLHEVQAELQEALARCSEALELFQTLGDREMEARTLASQGAILQRLGESDRALETFETVAELQGSLGDREGQAAALSNLGWIYHHVKGEPAAAIPHIQRAVDLAAGQDRSRAALLGNLSRAYLALGDTAEALRQGEAALALSRETQHPLGVASRHRDLGLVHLASGTAERAEEHFRAALAGARELGGRALEAEALHGLSQVRRREGDLEGALKQVLAAQGILEAVRTDVDSRSLKSTFTAFQRPVYEEEVALRVALARQTGSDRAVGAALEASERTRARGLLETLSEVGLDLDGGVDPALLEEERRLRRRLNEVELQRWRGEGEGIARDGEIRELLDALTLLEGRIRRAASPRYTGLARPRPLSLEQIQGELLDADSLLLEYSLGETESFLFAVTRDAVAVHPLPPAAEIESVAREVQGLLADPLAWRGSGWRGHERAFQDAASRLSALVLGPVQQALHGGHPPRLLIAGDGALLEIPFAALPMPSIREAGEAGEAGEYRPLVESHEIVHLPSASAVAVLRQQLATRPSAERTVAILADPVFEPWDARLRSSSEPEPEAGAGEPSLVAQRVPPQLRDTPREGVAGLRRLPQSRAEAEAIATLVPPAERLVALGLDASRETVFDPALKAYRILHFATHGVLNSRTPELSGLVLSLRGAEGEAQDGFLRLHDIYALELNAELVVLSACQTAQGKNLRGEGLVSLVRGFLYAGARSVVASLWQIDDQATALFMERFYGELLREGKSPAAALRAAQRAMAAGEMGEPWRSPSAWSTFVLQGEWRPLPLAPGRHGPGVR